MKKLEYTLLVVLLTSVFAIAVEIEERTIQSPTGKITVSVPKEWPAVDTHRTSAGKPYYQLGPANTNFSIQLYMNEPLQRGTNDEKRLERALETSLKPLVEKSVERKVELVHFGNDKDGIYARLTDPAPKPGEFSYYTRGLRIIGTNVLGFELVSNDKDFSALSNTLAVIESARVEGRDSAK